MIKTRSHFSKIRYITLSLLVCFVVWQIFVKYPLYESRKNSHAETYDAFEAIKEQVNRSRITVSVFYEALCPDSRSFFTRHLLPTYLKMKNALKIELIPYGKATMMEDTVDHEMKFDCQHGPEECLANKIHSCAIHNIEDPVVLLKYVTCLIDDDDPVVGTRCSNRLNIQWKLLHNCAHSSQGVLLLKKYGQLTNELRPPISFVPTILLNQNHHHQPSILKNLEKELCSIYQNILKDECAN